MERHHGFLVDTRGEGTVEAKTLVKCTSTTYCTIRLCAKRLGMFLDIFDDPLLRPITTVECTTVPATALSLGITAPS